MKSIKLTFGFTLVALGLANAASTHSFDLKHAVSIGGTELQAGSYKVEIQGDKAVIKSGRNVVEVPATLGTNDKKFGTTGIVTNGSKLIEIDFGGTTEKILFSAGTSQSAGGSN